MKKYCYVMVGIPGSGKTTWIKNNMFNQATIISTDAIIEDIAHSSCLTYNEVFEDNIEYATNLFFDDTRREVSLGHSIVIDRTNLTVKSRKRILSMFPKDYVKIAIVIKCSDDFIHSNRLSSRKGKNIPAHVIENMKKTYQEPTLEEGFNDINVFDTIPQLEEI